MSISSRTIHEGMNFFNKAKFSVKQSSRLYGSPIQLDDFVYYYLNPTGPGREESSLQPEFHSGRINIERLLSTDLDQFTLAGLQYYVTNKPDTFVNFALFEGSIMNLKRFCKELASNKNLIVKDESNQIFEANSPTSRTTFKAIKCVWVIYELLKKKFQSQTGVMTLEEVNRLFEDKIQILQHKLSSRCETTESSAFTMTEYKEMLSIGDIDKYMGERQGGKTKKRRLSRRRRHRCNVSMRHYKTKSKANHRR